MNGLIEVGYPPATHELEQSLIRKLKNYLNRLAPEEDLWAAVNEMDEGAGL